MDQACTQNYLNVAGLQMWKRTNKYRPSESHIVRILSSSKCFLSSRGCSTTLLLFNLNSLISNPCIYLLKCFHHMYRAKMQLKFSFQAWSQTDSTISSLPSGCCDSISAIWNWMRSTVGPSTPLCAFTDFLSIAIYIFHFCKLLSVFQPSVLCLGVSPQWVSTTLLDLFIKMLLSGSN